MSLLIEVVQDVLRWLAAAAGWLHGYGLLQLLLATVFGFFFAERWQRWRQRRDFQYRTLVKFSELSAEMMDRTAELLATRALEAPDIYEQKRRKMISRWTVFASMRDEVLAFYGRHLILSENYQGMFTAYNKLRGMRKRPSLFR